MNSGFIQPAEWAPHAACWLAWPSHVELWENHLTACREAFAKLCGYITMEGTSRASPVERLEILIRSQNDEKHARDALGGVKANLHRVPFGDIWLRDTGPIFVKNEIGQLRGQSFAFNGWGGKYVLLHDAEVAENICALTKATCRRAPWVLEGGAVEVDGEGTCLTTEACLLNPNRNPQLKKGDLERGLLETLGARKVLWLPQGLQNDHTDGHIDNLARFVAPGVVICMEARSAEDPNREVLGQIDTELRKMSDVHERRLEVVRIPSPGLVENAEGEPMPASYMNFYIANHTVIVPTYRSRWDDEALERLEGLFRGRKVVGVDATPLLSGGGAFHCITQQQPL